MEIDVRQIVLQALNFGILFAILAKFLFKPLLKILDERANTIQKGLQAAEKSMKDQESLEERARQEHIKAEKRAAAIIDKARAESKELGKQIVEEARAEAQKASVTGTPSFIIGTQLIQGARPYPTFQEAINLFLK